MTPKSNPSHIGQILEKVIRQKNFTPRMMESRIHSIWDDVVGEGVARNAQPGNLRGKTLHVVVSNSVWKQELFMLKGLIADKLNARLKSNVVEKLSFWVGRVDRQANEKKQPKQFNEVKLEEERLKAIEENIKNISDPDLKEALRALRVSEEKARKLRETTKEE